MQEVEITGCYATAQPASRVFLVRGGEVERLFEVGVVVVIRVSVVVWRIRKEAVSVLPCVGHTVAVGIRWRSSGSDFRSAADVSLRIDDPPSAAGHVGHDASVFHKWFQA